MDSQQFCVRWNSYQSNLQNAFPKLLTHEHFVDVTLACEAQSVKCHKVVLSACSAYFEKLLVQNPCQHPIIFMKDMKYWEVQALVDFMYKGEVNVHQDKLSSLLKAAEALQIKGLCGPDQDSSTSATASSDSVNLPQDTTVSDGRETPPSYKRRRTRPTEDSEDHLPAVIQRPPQGQLPPQVVQKSVPLNDSGLKRKSELAVTIPPSVTLQPPLPKPAPPASQPSPSVSSSLPPEQELPTKSDPLQDVMLPSERVKEEVITLDDMQDDQSDSRLDDDYGLVQQDESNSMMHEDTSSLDQPGPSGLASFAQIAMDKTVSEYYSSMLSGHSIMSVSPPLRSSGNTEMYPKKRLRRTDAELRKAAESVRDGMTFQQASNAYKIPISTIRVYMVRKGILPQRKRGRTFQPLEQYVHLSDLVSPEAQAASPMVQSNNASPQGATGMSCPTDAANGTPKTAKVNVKSELIVASVKKEEHEDAEMNDAANESDNAASEADNGMNELQIESGDAAESSNDELADNHSEVSQSNSGD